MVAAPLGALLIGLLVLTLGAVSCTKDKEQSRWSEAEHSNTVVGFERYLREFPHGEHAGEARAHIDDIEWNDAEQADTADAVREYLDEHPDGRHVDEATTLVEELDWTEALGGGLAEGFRFYLHEHPDGPHAAEAEARLDVLDWKDAAQDHTLLAFRRYLEQHPDGKFAKEAQARIERLEWVLAGRADTIRAYLEFIDQHPDSRFVSEARKQIERLKHDDSVFLRAQRDGSKRAYEEFLRDYPGHDREDDARRVLREFERDARGRDIFELIAEGKIEAHPTGSGISNVSVDVRRLVDHPVTVDIPVGTFFASSGFAQSMVTTRSLRFELNTNRSTTVNVDAACANIHRPIPQSGDRFVIRPSPDQDELRRVLPALSESDAPYVVLQAVVWILTDNADYADLGTLVFTSTGGFQERAIEEPEAARALRILDQAGIDITSKRIWADRREILRGLQKGDLKRWLQRRAG
jgi:outer membrane protein assembly factor BamD (BamD/ComL family)